MRKRKEVRRKRGGKLDESTLPVFILTHGRADTMKTAATLKRCGWTGPVYFIVDNEDSTVDRYRELYGAENVAVFDKKAVAERIDVCDNFEGRKVIIYARCASYDVARDLGYRYFIQLDDDYSMFWETMNEEGQFERYYCLILDEVLYAFLEYFKSLPMNVVTLAMAQGGDFIGGENSPMAHDLMLRRKAMNSFICDVERPIPFAGRMNEDVNAYICGQSMGKVCLTSPLAHLTQTQTQSMDGGMSEIYRSGGTYVKSFYSVIMSPSCISIGEMGDTRKRLHHKVKWNNAVPKILSEEHKK